MTSDHLHRATVKASPPPLKEVLCFLLTHLDVWPSLCNIMHVQMLILIIATIILWYFYVEEAKFRCAYTFRLSLQDYFVTSQLVLLQCAAYKCENVKLPHHIQGHFSEECPALFPYIVWIFQLRRRSRLNFKNLDLN